MGPDPDLPVLGFHRRGWFPVTTALIVLLGTAGPSLLAAGLIAEHIAPPAGPCRTAPALDTCAAPGCTRPVPAGEVWCGWLCRNLDDPHDLDDLLYGGDDA